MEDEEDVVLTFEEGGEVTQQEVREATIRIKTTQQLKQLTITVGFHHGHLNPLPASWRYPKGMNMIQMITLYQMGCPSDVIPPLKVLKSGQVNHFDKEGTALSRMSRIMCVVKEYATRRKCGSQRVLQITGREILLQSYGMLFGLTWGRIWIW
jgi:hypothetical protein